MMDCPHHTTVVTMYIASREYLFKCPDHEDGHALTFADPGHIRILATCVDCGEEKLTTPDPADVIETIFELSVEVN